MKKLIILKRLLLSTAVLTVASTAIIVQQHNSVDKTVKTEECSKQDIVSNSVESKLEKSAISKPAEEPKAEQPVVSKPVEEPKEECSKQDIVSNSVESKVEKSAISKPVEEPKVEQPVVSKPVEEPKVERPVVSKPVEAPKVEQPTVSKPVEQPKVEAPAVEKPVETKTAPQPKVESPKAEVPTTPTPKVEQPKVETPKVETPVAPQPKTETPAPKVEAPVVAEKGEPLVQPELPEYHEAKGEPEVQPALTELAVPAENTQPEQPVVSEKGEPLVQPELPEFHAETGDALVQPELPEATVPAEEPEAPSVAQPTVPEAPVISEKGEPLVQPELPEFHSEKGTPEIQPELPEFHFETGDALVQPELPEYHEAKGEPLVQPELPEYHEEKGEPEVQPELLEYKIKTVTREEVIPVLADSITVNNPELNEGETEIVTQPKDGSITRTYEDILDEHDNVLSTKLVNETRVEAIKGVTSIGTKPVKKVFGEEGNYRFSEHLADENILEFREDVKLTADEIHALGQDEINKRVEQNFDNTITVQDKTRPNVSQVYTAPLSDETINNLNGDTYINHKNIGLKVLELVNAERKRLGVHELTWSDPLYTLTKVRANEVRENGSIRFYTEDGQELKHVRDNKGTKWHTVKEGTEFEDSAMGENLASYSVRPNIYKTFSEKYIAEQLYDQWKNSPHHYANMIKEKYNLFAFDLAYSKFWRDGYSDATYKRQGVLGVQLFADE